MNKFLLVNVHERKIGRIIVVVPDVCLSLWVSVCASLLSQPVGRPLVIFP